MDEKKIKEEFERSVVTFAFSFSKNHSGDYSFGETQLAWAIWQCCAAHYEKQLAAKDAEIAELRQKLEEFKVALKTAQRLINEKSAKLEEYEKQEPILCVNKADLTKLKAADSWIKAFPASVCFDGELKLYAAPVTALAPGEVLQPIETAPKDGSMLLLMVDFEHHATEDCGTGVTIGFNQEKDTGEDVWQFAGWDWCQDCFTEGYGTPTYWMPLPANPAKRTEEKGD